MRRSSSGIAMPGSCVHSGVLLFPKWSVLVLVLAFLVLPARAAKASGPAAEASSSSKSSAKKKAPKKKRRRSTSQRFIQKAPTPDRISDIQAALARGGYYQGDPNGKWDGNTVAALQKFQSANGLDSTGKLDALSLQKLGLGSDIAGVSAPRPVTPPGSAGLSSPLSGPPSSESPTPTSPSAGSLPGDARQSSGAGGSGSPNNGLHGDSSVAASNLPSR